MDLVNGLYNCRVKGYEISDTGEAVIFIKEPLPDHEWRKVHLYYVKKRIRDLKNMLKSLNVHMSCDRSVIVYMREAIEYEIEDWSTQVKLNCWAIDF